MQTLKKRLYCKIQSGFSFEHENPGTISEIELKIGVKKLE